VNSLVRVPFLGANDEHCDVVQWHVAGGSRVGVGDPLCTIETTKAAVEVYSEHSGFAYPLAEKGARVSIDAPLCLVAEKELEDVKRAVVELLGLTANGEHADKHKFTKKAQLFLARHHLSETDVVGKLPSGRITEEMVRALIDIGQSEERPLNLGHRQRIAVIGGVSGGGALIVIDSMLRNPQQQPVCIFDRDPAVHGKHVLGVPVVGSIDMLDDWHQQGRLDAVIIAFNRNLEERASTFEALRNRGLEFANVVDPSAQIRSGVQLGVGNVVLAQCYVGPCSTIGDNNFISAGVHLEHDNMVGSHCGFGPHVATSGNVTIGNRIRFGIGIFVEPSVRVGDDCLIASGSILIGDVPSEHAIQAAYHQKLKKLV